MSWIYLGKVNTGKRIYLRNCGFSDGDTILFLKNKNNNRVYLTKSDEIIGVGTISGGRVKIPEKVCEILNIDVGDYFGIINDKEANVSIATDMRIVKVVRGEDDEGT